LSKTVSVWAGLAQRLTTGTVHLGEESKTILHLGAFGACLPRSVCHYVFVLIEQNGFKREAELKSFNREAS